LVLRSWSCGQPLDPIERHPHLARFAQRDAVRIESLDRRAEQPFRETNLELHPHKLMVVRDRHAHIMTKGCDNYADGQRTRISTRNAGLCWWPRKCIIRVGPDLGGERGGAQCTVGTRYAWSQRSQRARTRSVKNLERVYLRPFIVGRESR
jgi:hypothetical protein